MTNCFFFGKMKNFSRGNLLSHSDVGAARRNEPRQLVNLSTCHLEPADRDNWLAQLVPDTFSLDEWFICEADWLIDWMSDSITALAVSVSCSSAKTLLLPTVPDIFYNFQRKRFNMLKKAHVLPSPLNLIHLKWRLRIWFKKDCQLSVVDKEKNAQGDAGNQSCAQLTMRSIWIFFFSSFFLF